MIYKSYSKDIVGATLLIDANTFKFHRVKFDYDVYKIFSTSLNQDKVCSNNALDGANHIM